jgi:methionine-gamma-lyase
MTSEDLQQAGISPGLVRLSIGYTGTLEQRWQQMKQALSQYEQSR